MAWLLALLIGTCVLQAFIEFELQKKTATADENNNMFFSGRAQTKIDGHWLKSYVNTVLYCLEIRIAAE